MTLATVASGVGHGAMGLRSGLRSMDDLVQQSRCQKHIFAELRGAKLLTVWTLHSGSIWKVTTNETFRGRRADCVSVKTATETLTRAQSLTEVIAGYFYAESDSNAAVTLYVRLGDSSDPNGTDVYGVFAFHFGTCNVSQAMLAPSLFTDGGLEIWTSSTNLTNWTEETIGNGGGTVATQESTTVFLGTYSCVFGGAHNTAGGRGIMQTTTAVGGANSAILGKPYRFSGAYRTAADIPAGLAAAIQVQIGSDYVTDDGRSWTTSNTRLSLTPTNGRWARFALDYMPVANGHHIARVMAYNTSAARASNIYFDDLRLSRVNRYELHEPRLSLDSVPRSEEGRTGIYFDQWTIGSGTLTLLNGDDALETLFGSYEWVNQEVYIRVGGKFPGGGNEILPEDMLVKRWIIRRVQVADTQAVLQLDDPRTIFQERLPNRYYNTSDFSDIATVDIGRPRPLVFGNVENIRPARVDLTANGYGIYEVLDGNFGLQTLPTQCFTVVAAHTYMDEEAAEKALTSRRLEIGTLGGGTLSTTTLGHVEITSDVQLVDVTDLNNLLDFLEGAATLLGVSSTVGLACLTLSDGGSHPSVDELVTNALNSAGGTYTFVYSDSTHEVTVTQTAPATTFQILLASTATNRDRSLWPFIGFTGNTDLTGSLNYTGEALLVDLDAQHILRFRARGYKDDSSGTYTGTPSADIQLPCDIQYFLLRKVFGLDPALLDTGSLTAARSGAQNVHVYLGGLQSGGAAADTSHEFGQTNEWLENSGGVELLVRNGLFTWKKRDNTTPANIVDLYDRDYLSFEGWIDYDDMASTIRMESYANPSTGQVASVETSSSTAKLRLGRTVTKVVTTYFATLVEAQDSLDAFSVNASTPRRRFRFRTKKLLKHIPGDKVRLNREAGFLGRTDSATSVVVRIIRKVDDLQTWESEIEAAEVLTGVTDGW